MSTTNRSILDEANAAIMQGDYEQFLSFCTDDKKWIFIGDKKLEGKEAVRKWMEVEYKEPPKFTVSNYIEDGDFLAVLGEIIMKDEDGKEIPYNYCDVWKFRDGKMAELNAFVIKS